MDRRALALVVVIATAWGAGATQAGSPEDDLRWLNERRAANGIPGDVIMNPDWARACAAHLRYMAATGTITHSENPAESSFTREGDWAARNAILASTLPWTAQRFIWEDAPLHMTQVLAPILARTGIADDGGLVCLTTLPGFTRPTPTTTTVLTYPGNAGRARERVFTRERPLTPSEALGISNPTGPPLYVFQWGPTAATGVDGFGQTIGIAGATLVSVRGRERVAWVDRRNPLVGRYLPNASGIVIPIDPLVADVSYTATVRFTNGVSHSWSFVTDGPSGATKFVGVRLAARRLGAFRVCVRRVDGVCVKRRVRYTHRLIVRGRLIESAGGGPVVGAPVGVAFRGAERPVLTTDARGAFVTRYLVRSFKRPYSINVALTSTDAVPAGYRIRLS